ncbi:MAG TPA: dihydrolipoamide acetyltransferase family protein [Candidatus Limnocylindrales bacterium]|nr:dihydrolipoamide acetyltransferase family protein [Candidatus Limnocylindrales bacterium]
MAKVTMPQLGESVAEGTIGKWLKQPGDTVEKYEPLLEVITDKVNAEVPSPFAGVLREILVEEGATVPNNAEIAVIETADEGGAAAATPPVALEAAGGPEAEGTVEVEPRNVDAAAGSPSRPSFTPADGPAGSDERPERAAATAQTPAPASSPAPTAAAQTAPAAASASLPTAVAATNVDGDAPGNPDARMTPAVRRLLREHGLTPAQIVGTGGGGRITREDVTNYVETQRTGAAVGGQSVDRGTAVAASANGSANGASTPAPAAPAGSSVPSTGPAPAPGATRPGPASTTAAPSAPPTAPASAGTKIEFPAGADEVLVPLTQMRKGIAAQMTRALQAPHAYVQMEVDATRLVAARERANREYRAKEGVGLSYVPFVVKAAAVALKKNPTFNAHWTEEGLMAKRRVNIGVAVAVDDGLIVPVIRDADQLSIHGLNVAILDVANRARINKLRVDDFGGGTFTVDNTGYLGTNLVMPIINVPEVGIVTMEAITKRPVVVSTPDGDVIAIRPVMNMVLGVDHRANDGAGGAALLRDIKAWLESVGPDTAIY